MKLVGCVVILSLSTVFSSPVSSEFVPGNVFVETCNNPAPDRQAACVAYTAGIVDSFLRSGQFCLPPNISPKEISDFTKSYINRTASIRGQSALMMVLYALKAKWPCTGGGPRMVFQFPPQFNFRGF
jgi:hypothetical protein